MALNVQKNIQAIGAQADLVIEKETIHKERYIDERTNTSLLRVDNNDVATRIETKVLDEIKNNTFMGVSYDAITISDYCEGFLIEEDIFARFDQ